MSNQILASAARTATNNLGDNQKVPGAKGVKVVFDVTAVPGIDTVTLTIQGKDRVSGKYYTILSGAAVVATGTAVYTVFPGVTVAANVSASDVLPDQYRILLTHSAATSFTYSVSVDELF